METDYTQLLAGCLLGKRPTIARELRWRRQGALVNPSSRMPLRHGWGWEKAHPGVRETQVTRGWDEAAAGFGAGAAQDSQTFGKGLDSSTSAAFPSFVGTDIPGDN